MTRLAIRGYIGGVRQFEERVVTNDEGDGLEELSQKHVLKLLALPGGNKHMIEVEFLDEPDPLQRFCRFGTDPAGMVRPIGIPLSFSD